MNIRELYKAGFRIDNLSDSNSTIDEIKKDIFETISRLYQTENVKNKVLYAEITLNLL